MDAADWYLNLSLRKQITEWKDTDFRDFVVKQYIHSRAPILKRGDSLPFVFFFSEEKIELGFRSILQGHEPALGVTQLRGDEFYGFEQMFPAEVRTFGSQFVPGKSEAKDAPEKFAGPIDALFERRMLGAFARIDLSLPDEVLVEDFRDYIADRRREFLQIGGPQPYRLALQELRGRRKAKFKTFEQLKVLPYMDLQWWLAARGGKVSSAAMANALDLGSDDLRETKKYADLLFKPFLLSGWLRRSARLAIRKSKK